MPDVRQFSLPLARRGATPSAPSDFEPIVRARPSWIATPPASSDCERWIEKSSRTGVREREFSICGGEQLQLGVIRKTGVTFMSRAEALTAELARRS